MYVSLNRLFKYDIFCSSVLHDNKSYEEILSQQVNWNDVDDKIEKMKESSINFLKSSLND